MRRRQRGREEEGEVDSRTDLTHCSGLRSAAGPQPRAVGIHSIGILRFPKCLPHARWWAHTWQYCRDQDSPREPYSIVRQKS